MWWGVLSVYGIALSHALPACDFVECLYNYFVYQAGGVSDSRVKSEQRVGSAGWERWQILKMWIGTKFWHA